MDYVICYRSDLTLFEFSFALMASTVFTRVQAHTQRVVWSGLVSMNKYKFVFFMRKTIDQIKNRKQIR